MPIFISYSSVDRDFVDRLAKQLVAHRVSVWLDKWEIHVGDSLITKIQNGITGASGLLVVLSKNSVKSEWCRKELNAALIRELEEKRVVVLPLLLEPCDIPMFLREKLYADFSKDYDEGLRVTLEAIARVTNEWRARVTDPGWHTDSAIDWFSHGPDHHIRITMVEQAKDQPYSVLGITEVIAHGPAAKWYESHIKACTDDDARAQVIYALADAVKDDDDFNVLLKDQHQVVRRTLFTLHGHVFPVISTVRWLGMDTGRDVLFHMGGQIEGMAEMMREIRKQPPTGSEHKSRIVRPIIEHEAAPKPKAANKKSEGAKERPPVVNAATKKPRPKAKSPSPKSTTKKRK